MPDHSISRRAVLGATVIAGSALGQSAPLTVAAVIDRIKKNVGVPWREQTVDNLIAGAPETTVRGIATTMMATLDVLKRASAAGKNLVITHEPTFYSHQDTIDPIKDDSVYKFKTDFIREHDMAVFHFHDHWHARKPDGIAAGMARELGWEAHREAENQRLFRFEGMTLAKLAKHIETKLGARTVRVVGSPSLDVKQVLASWGYVGQPPAISLFAKPDVNVFVCGETREWELVEYAQDAVAAGQKKGLIVIGHVASEQAGMKLCAEWLRGFITEAPVDFVAAAEPFWNPQDRLLYRAIPCAAESPDSPVRHYRRYTRGPEPG